MAKIKKIANFQALRWIVAAKVGLFCGFFPAYSPVTDGMHWVEVSGTEARRAEIIKIHSIMKRSRKGLDEASAWSLAETISTEAKKHGLDPVLVLAVINVESRFHHQKTSPDGARGLMQIRPFVGSNLAEQTEMVEDWEGAESLDDPILNVKLGIFYLGSLKKRFKNMELALTAYNWGPTRVQSRLEEDEPISLDYAERVLSNYEDLRQPFQIRRAGWKESERSR